MRSVKIKLPIFKAVVSVSVGGELPDGMAGTCYLDAGVAEKLGVAIAPVICVEEYDIPTLVHECIHAANFIFDKIGHHGSPADDEILAYTAEYIVRKAMEVLWQKET